MEPAIFGTLVEQALNPEERKKLGAHYTPRAYVERLVHATIIDPLREQWHDIGTAVETHRGEPAKAINAVQGLQNQNLGGFPIDFSARKHTGSRFVELTLLTEDGRVRR